MISTESTLEAEGTPLAAAIPGAMADHESMEDQNLSMTNSAAQRQAPPTSAEIDAVIAAAMANAPPAPPPMDVGVETASARSLTPLMTNILPSAIGSDGRVNLFVGNLPYRVRWQDLKDLFRKAGTVLRADVSLGPDNRSRGYGNVLMGSREDAARAIDRFNGFTWQTRTLEVRPDRLPPEYEPQPHVHHKPMYGYGPGPMQHFGGGGAWPHRPPHHGPVFGGFSQQLGPHPHGGLHHPQFGRSPHLSAHTVMPLGASPLAGSLSVGGPSAPGGAIAPPSWPTRDSLSPFVPLSESGTAGRTASPLGAPLSLENKRPASPVNKQVDDALKVPGRAAPAILAAGVKGAFVADLDSHPNRPGSTVSDASPHLTPPPIALNGLANQAKDLGAPNTLVDRVVFVKNLSSTTQWQDLKDLFRPAGVVIRADVATGPDGQSRGFGTVLFASKDDALNSVGMFNGQEVDGRVLHVQTERQTLEDKHIAPVHPSADAFSTFATRPSPPAWTHTTVPGAVSSKDTESFAPSSSNAPSPTALRVPWQLNTVAAGQPTTTPPRKDTMDDASQRQARHPGPISLPPFPAMSEINPISPLQTRNMPPMTPSMPGFVFNAYPRTPPVHPQFLSPGGAGPFSPGLPVTSPMVGRRSPFLNAAPGAPVLQPPLQQFHAGSAALGTPTTQAFPPNAPHSTAGPPGAHLSEDYFPPVGASPLNGRDRLASSSEDNSLIKSTAALTLSEASSASPSPTPPRKRSISGDRLAPGAAVMASKNGRSSLDGPYQSLSAWNTDRRASWSEIASHGR